MRPLRRQTVRTRSHAGSGRWSSRSGTRRDGQTRPSWPCGCQPHRRAPRSHRSRHRGCGRGTRGHRPPDTGRPHWTVDSGSWTSHARTLDVHPDTRHRTRGRDRVLRQGDLDTAGTRQISRTTTTTTTTRPPAGTPNHRPVDGACCARQRRRLGEDEVPVSARLPIALPGACSVALSAKPRPGALLSSDDFGSRVEREAHGQVLWRGHVRAAGRAVSEVQP
jgi:hypothetical protein